MRTLVGLLLVFGCETPKGTLASDVSDTGSASPQSEVFGHDDGASDDEPGSGPTTEEGDASDTADRPDEEDDLPEIVSARLDVNALRLTTTPESTSNHQFKFIVTFDDGTRQRLTTGVEWALNNAHIGSVSADGLFITSSAEGGKADVIGRYEDHTAMAEVTVRYEGEYVPEGFDVTLFDAPEVEWEGSGMIYPEDGTTIPKNQPSIHFQWENMSASGYRLRFESEVTELTIYSTSLDWISDSEMWPIIGRSNAGLDITSRLSARVGDEVVVRDRQTMSIQDLEATGSIIYWTPTAQGLMEIPYGETARNFLTVEETGGRCVGCHAISSEGMVAFVYDGSSAPLGMKTMETLEDVIPYGTAGNSNYKAFSPDGTLLISTLNGTLSLFDGITGDLIRNPIIDDASWVNNVDWAPDDSHLVFVDSPGISSDLNFTGGRIMRAPHLGDGEFGPAETIVEVTDLDPSYGFTTIYYPAVSPDSNWIMFNASTGDTYDDPDATLFVVSIDGGTPIELANANITPSTGNSLPKWAPATSGDDYWWFAFASRRPYGSITSGLHQIWLASFDPAKAAAGEDPSSLAIWLSNQDTAQSNHIPLWVR